MILAFRWSRVSAAALGMAVALAARGEGAAAHQPQPDTSSEIEAKKSYAIPAAEILVFQYLLNRFDRRAYGADYGSNLSTVRRNLRSHWVVDNDPFKVNQFLHPYAGSMYYGFARSAGLNFWESLGYSFAGSAIWEIAGETTLPSRNDQIATGIAGSFLGESFYRMASLLLEQSDGPQLWRELAAAAISPPMALNRYGFGDRFSALLNSHSPVYYSRLQIGTSGTTQNDPGASSGVKRGELQADFSLDYGLPGKPGYTYDRPFDYFSFQVTGSSANVVESLSNRGLLFGRSYDVGDRYRGIW